MKSRPCQELLSRRRGILWNKLTVPLAASLLRRAELQTVSTTLAAGEKLTTVNYPALMTSLMTVVFHPTKGAWS